MDPNLDVEPSLLSKPIVPKIQEASLATPAKTVLKDLSLSEQQTYRLLQDMYKVENAKWETRRKRLETARNWATSSMSQEYMVHITDYETPYQIIKALKHVIAPSAAGRKQDVIRKQEVLKENTFKDKEVEATLREQEKTFNDTKKLYLLDVDDERLL